jgi:hypothetical protein
LETNRGEEGFRDFFLKHRCNDVCLRLGLQSTGRDLRNSSLSFRKVWPLPTTETGRCSNPICGRILRDTHITRQEKHLWWCKQCRPQLERSTVKRVCSSRGPHHEFSTKIFYYKIRGLQVPTMCEQHR